jgi:hypothetical protein
MAKIALPGGTDVAEMALFSVDALSADRYPDPATLAAMEAQHVVMRFPTGADGGYLLHIYLDEAIPEEVMKYCASHDAVCGRLKIERGRLGFGGVESLCGSFSLNPSIRTDAQVPPGDYDVTGYHAEYPDELIEAAVKAKIGQKAWRILALPGYVILIAFLSTLVALATKSWYLAAFVIAATFFGLKFLFFRNGRIRHLKEQKLSIEMNYPSIVVRMSSNNSR